MTFGVLGVGSGGSPLPTHVGSGMLRGFCRGVIVSLYHLFLISIQDRFILPSQDQMVEVVFGAKSRFSTHIESFTPSPRKSPQK